MTSPLPAACHGTPPLTARWESWMTQLLGDPGRVSALLETYGSPVNVHEVSALPRNADELIAAAESLGVALRPFVARKANKTFAVVEAARDAGLGVDVGSDRELEQVLGLGVPARDIVVTAAMKPEPLLRRTLEAGAVLVLDNLDEAESTMRLVQELRLEGPAPIALRLAPAHGGDVAPTRFGESAARWMGWVETLPTGSPLRLEGVHFHLHGYATASRAQALGEALSLVDALRAAGHSVSFIDIGGGIPMSYLDSAQEWQDFWAAHDGQSPEHPVTWRGQQLRQVYPYHQSPTRGDWMRALLSSPVAGDASAPSIAHALRTRELELRCEPGRSVLDGCGMTLARVVQRTTTSDGVPLVGLEMNRTQCRSTSDDFLADPMLVRGGADPSEPMSAYLVGAYCIEEELILRRPMTFPGGVAIGDVIALPNTAGYLMHILESASHQIPLASNVVLTGDGVHRDGIDGISPLRPF